MYSAPCQMRENRHPKWHAMPCSKGAHLSVINETRSGSLNVSTQCIPTHIQQPQSVQSGRPIKPYYSNNTTVPRQTTACPQVPNEVNNSLFNVIQGNGLSTFTQHGHLYPPGQLYIAQGLHQSIPLNLSSQPPCVKQPDHMTHMQNSVSTCSYQHITSANKWKTNCKKNMQSPQLFPAQATLHTSFASTAVSSAEHNVHVANNRNHNSGHRTNMHGESSYPLQCMSSSVRNNGTMLNVPSAQCLSLPQLIPKTQNTPTQAYRRSQSAPECAITENESYTIATAGRTGRTMPNSQMLCGISDRMNLHFTAGSHNLLNNTTHSGNAMKSVKMDKITRSGPPAQLDGCIVNDRNRPTFSQPFAQQTGQDLPRQMIPDSTSNSQHNLEALSAQGTPFQGFYVIHVSQYVLSNGHQLSSPNSRGQPQKPVSTVSRKNNHGHTSPHKVVAVVQPLTQEMCTDASQEGCSMITDQCKENTSIEKACNVTDSTNLNNDCGVNEKLHTTVHGNVMESHQAVSPAQQAENTEVKQSREMDKTKEREDSLVDIVELSSIPWTYTKLTTYIDEASKIQGSDESSNISVIRKLLSLYWNNNPEHFIRLVHINFYSTLMTEVKKYFHEHVNCDTVILSQVNPERKDELEKRCCIITQDYVHSEVPYVSSWMNVNKQLDDIDKEFGFPTSLKSNRDKLEHVAQKNSCISETTLSERQAEVELESVVPTNDGNNLKSDTETSLTPIIDPSDDDIMTDPNDPHYSFKIEVMSQDMAKMVYEQIHSNIVDHGEKSGPRSESVTIPLKCELSEAVEVKSSKVKLENKPDCPLDEFCCITRWIGVALESTNISLCKCQPEPESKELTVPSLEADEVGLKESPGVIMLDVEVVPTTVGKCDAHNKQDEEPLISIWTNLWNICETIDLTGDDEGPSKYSCKDIKNTIVPKSECYPSLIAEEIVNVLSSNDNNVFFLEDCGQAKWKASSPAGGQGNIILSDNPVRKDMLVDKTNASPSSVQKNRHTVGVKPCILHSNNKEIKKCKKSFTVPEKPLCSLKKRNKYQALDRYSQPANTGILKWINGCSDAGVTTAKLALSSSSVQKKNHVKALRSHVTFTKDTLAQTPPPSAVLSVTSSSLLSPSPKETVPVRKWPVKRRLQEEWRNSYPPYKTKCKSKPVAEKYTTFPVQHVTPNTALCKTQCTTDTENLPVSSAKPKQSLTRRRSIRLDVKRRLKNPMKNVSLLKNIADHSGIKYEIRKEAFMPTKEDNVLSFSFLPNTFNFKDVPTETDEATYSGMPDTPILVDANKEGPKEIMKTKRGAWIQNPEKIYIPLVSSPLVPKTAAMFQEFKKKYKEKQLAVK